MLYKRIFEIYPDELSYIKQRAQEVEITFRQAKDGSADYVLEGPMDKRNLIDKIIQDVDDGLICDL